ncbi:MAG: hypothetical protein NT005_01100 [Spirochaetes bacterium]|nr:hypothetical protein [Spirochaetota bacterium]
MYTSELKKLVDRETASQVAALQAEIKKNAAYPLEYDEKAQK